MPEQGQNFDRGAEQQRAQVPTAGATTPCGMPQPDNALRRPTVDSARAQADRRRSESGRSRAAATVEVAAAAGGRGGGGGGGGGVEVAGAVVAAVVVAAAGVNEEHANMKTIKQTVGVVAAVARTWAPRRSPSRNSRFRRPRRRPTPWSTPSPATTAMRSRPSSDRTTASTFRRRASTRKTSRNFLEAWAKAHKIVPAGADRAYPRCRNQGLDHVDPASSRARRVGSSTRTRRPRKCVIRRIGRNELAAIQVALAYTDAQKEYHARDWNRDGVLQYATRGLSSPGKHDGLYWASLPGEPESPLGAEFAEAKVGQPYHGYLYRILTAQGKDAPGGARSYLKNGRMTEGYALVAWPAKYDDTGVMTFIVNQDGVVYQKDLGDNTAAAVRSINAYNPDSTWSKVTPTK